ncbi:MAG: tetratricopeptide repeat protein [Bradymonadaceae bacterium]
MVLAGVDQDRGAYETSLDRLDAAQQLFEGAGDRDGIARGRRRKGLTYSNVGKFERAETFFERARVDFEQVGNSM